MIEFICGLFFFIVGVALLIHNKTLVLRSGEFHRANLMPEKEQMIFFNRILCVSAGLITLTGGYLTMLYRK
jgi:hypothetical protein